MLRLHFVQVNGESSENTKINYGVPQGSVLGPILLTLYTICFPLTASLEGAACIFTARQMTHNLINQ